MFCPLYSAQDDEVNVWVLIKERSVIYFNERNSLTGQGWLISIISEIDVISTRSFTQFSKNTIAFFTN